jgi:putative CocE/NonD family hydrolase
VSDPARPEPNRVRTIPATFGQGSKWSTWLADDQRFVSDRQDVSVWQTAPLDDDVVIAGDVLAKLYASTTGSDADFVVKLIDVYPAKYDANPKLGGYQLMVSNDVFRSRFRKSFEKPQPLTPNKPEEVAIDLHTQSYRFKKGHRIMVQVQSSWFPLIDRNPQTYVPNIFEAKPSDFRVATQKIFRSPDKASFISLPVVQSKVVQ